MTTDDDQQYVAAGASTRRIARSTVTAAPNCRSCMARLRHTFVDLGEQPLSNGFLTREQLEVGDDPRYPLHARICDSALSRPTR